jgi:hypothetical protein
LCVQMIIKSDRKENLRVEEKATHRRVSMAQEIIGLSANHAANDTSTIQNDPLRSLRSRNGFASFLKLYTNRRREDQEVIVARRTVTGVVQDLINLILCSN